MASEPLPRRAARSHGWEPGVQESGVRNRLPIVAVAALGLLSAGAIALGVAQTPRQVYFTYPTVGGSSAAAALRAAANATMHASSFSVYAGNRAIAVYQSPDRVLLEPLSIVIVGTELYTKTPTPSASGRWVEQTSPTPWNAYVFGVLEPLAGVTEAQRHGDHFTTVLSGGASQLVPAGIPVLVSAQVSRGRVVATSLRLDPQASKFVVARDRAMGAHVSLSQIDRVHTTRFSTFNHAPRVRVPSRAMIKSGS